MSLLVTRANPTNWVAGNLLTALQVNTLDSNTIAVADYLESQRIDVKLYGAVGDNSTDDSTAIQDAFDAAATAGVAVWFPPGSYRFNNILWGACSFFGEPNESFLKCNSTSNPLFTSTTSHGLDATTYTARTVRGVAFDLVTTSTLGELVRLGGDNRVLFDTCHFDNQGSSASGVGALSLGTSSGTTRVILHNCSFDLSGANDLAVGLVDGTTHVMMSNCRIRLLSTARAALYGLVGGTIIKVANTYIDLSVAQASATNIKVFGVSASSDISVSNTTVTAAASGVAELYTGSAAVITDAANNFPADAIVRTLSPGTLNATSRNRILELSQTGGGSCILDTLNYNFFNVSIGDNTDFTMSATAAPLGTEFDLMLRRSASPSGTITWSTSIFASFGTVGDGFGMAVQLLPGQIASGRFRRATTSAGERWVLIGSGVLFQ